MSDPYRAAAPIDAEAARRLEVHRATHVTDTNPTRTVVVDGKPVTECVDCGERTTLTLPK